MSNESFFLTSLLIFGLLMAAILIVEIWYSRHSRKRSGRQSG